MEYRQLPSRDTWHYHPKCQWWHRTSYKKGVKQTFRKPTTGEFCNECQAKARKSPL